MKKLFLCVMLFGATVIATAQVKTKPAVKTPAKTAKPSPFKNNLDSIAYSIGVNIAGSLKQQELGKINTLILQKGLDDALKNKKTTIDPEMCNSIIQTYMQEMQQKNVAKAQQQINMEKSRSAAFLDSVKKRPGVITLSTGLQYEVLRKSTDTTGAKPKIGDTVVVNYAGTLVDGTEFDNSYKRGEPLTYPLSMFVPGWVQALEMMHIGDKWKLYIPSELGYGDRGTGGGAIPGGAALVFELELLGIKPAAAK